MKINLTLVLLLGWVFLIISTGTISGLFAFKIGKKTLSQVQKPEASETKALNLNKKAYNPKIIAENNILMRVNNYIKLQEEMSKELKPEEQNSSQLPENISDLGEKKPKI